MQTRTPLPSRLAMRLGGHDYASPGHYFVTLVTHRRRCVLSEVRDDLVALSELGQLADAEWLALEQRFTSVKLGTRVIMPNHIHALLEMLDVPETPAHRTLSRIVAAFKNRVTLVARQEGLHGALPLWQRGFHDRVVRDGIEHERIERYIVSNPFNWPQDPENPHAVTARLPARGGG